MPFRRISSVVAASLILPLGVVAQRVEFGAASGGYFPRAIVQNFPRLERARMEYAYLSMGMGENTRFSFDPTVIRFRSSGVVGMPATDLRGTALAASFQLRFRNQSAFRPFISFGGGGIRYAAPEVTKFTALGGIGIEIRPTRHLGFRSSYQAIVTPIPTRGVMLIRHSVLGGIVFGF